MMTTVSHRQYKFIESGGDNCHECGRPEYAAIHSPGLTTQPAPDTGEWWQLKPEPIHGWQIMDQNNQVIAANLYCFEDAVRIVNDHNAAERLTEILNELLVEAEVSNVLWQQSRGFVGTVQDAYEQGLMPPVYVRARDLLTTPRKGA
jgi:hypothetical protein